MYNSIILSASLFGSVYIFVKSFELTNKALLENNKMSRELMLINGLTLGLSGSMFVYYSFKILNA